MVPEYGFFNNVDAAFYLNRYIVFFVNFHKAAIGQAPAMLFRREA
jgi:hypothetical protein